MKRAKAESQFVVCIHNEGYAASLELRKIYQTIPDAAAATRRFLRVVDESGEDYLYPDNFFMPIELPQKLEKVLATAA